MAQTTTNSRDVKATPEEVYNAFITPSALEYFQAPGQMTAKVHGFDYRVGGGYQMSLYYPESEKKMKGKTSGKEDKFYAKFVEIIPAEKIVEAIEFDSTNADFSGQMIMEVSFEPIDIGTRVTFLFKTYRKESSRVITKQAPFPPWRSWRNTLNGEANCLLKNRVMAQMNALGMEVKPARSGRYRNGR